MSRDSHGRLRNEPTDNLTKRLNKTHTLVQSLSSKLWLMMRLNILFLVFCIPILTIPASVTAMTKVLMAYIKEDDCAVWSCYWREFKDSFIKSIGAGLIMGVFIAAVLLIGYGIYALSGGFVRALGIGIIIVFEVLIYIILCYLFALIATVHIGLKQCLKNAFLLMMIEFKHNLLLLMPLGLLIASVLLYPVTLPLLALIMFSLCQYIICKLVNGAIRRRITDPYYKQASVSM